MWGTRSHRPACMEALAPQRAQNCSGGACTADWSSKNIGGLRLGGRLYSSDSTLSAQQSPDFAAPSTPKVPTTGFTVLPAK